MKMTPAIKGQLTKAVNLPKPNIEDAFEMSLFRAASFHRVLAVFKRHMPKQQAKHATKRYLAAHAS